MGLFKVIKKGGLLLGTVIAIGMLTSCSVTRGQTETTDTQTAIENAEKLSIVCTTYPQYDWVLQILGKDQTYADVVYLLKNGVDIHSYQPSAEDMIRISESDLFIYVGGESDQWVENALKNVVNEKQKSISLMEVLGEQVKQEEIVEGMQTEEDHTEEGHAEAEHTEEPEYDEHVWLSLHNAELFCEAITAAICELDGEHNAVYEANKSAYAAKLEELNAAYQAAVNEAAEKTILFADRFPFRYLVDDYGLEYFAAFAGCSAETEASFETITFLSSKVEELALPAIFIIETSDGSIARTVVSSTKEKNQSILTLDSLQSVTAKEIEGGLTYLSVMENNLEQLKQGLQ